MNDDSLTLFDESEDPIAEADRLRSWMAEVSDEGWVWYVKYLSANDTLANGSHQRGTYIARPLLRIAFPQVAASVGTGNDHPQAFLHITIDSHDFPRDVRMVWYHDKHRGGTRNEARITQWGTRDAPVLDPESTGSLCVFAFCLIEGRDAQECRAWLCRNLEETQIVQEVVGPVDPGEGALYSSGRLVLDAIEETDTPCRLSDDSIPEAWRTAFPSTTAIVAMAVGNMRSVKTRPTPADLRLIRRLACEYDIFRAVERYHVLPRLKEQFGTVDIFVQYANHVTNRRKTRAGASLELQAEHIFIEEGLAFDRGKVSEGKKKPDFLFPSASAYHDLGFPEAKLRMLAAKTTCKDRWRQVINEAKRIPVKHLLTLQMGVSQNQWREMDAENVRLVVPKANVGSFPASVRPHLVTLEQFIRETKLLHP